MSRPIIAAAGGKPTIHHLTAKFTNPTARQWNNEDAPHNLGLDLSLCAVVVKLVGYGNAGLVDDNTNDELTRVALDLTENAIRIWPSQRNGSGTWTAQCEVWQYPSGAAKVQRGEFTPQNLNNAWHNLTTGITPPANGSQVWVPHQIPGGAALPNTSQSSSAFNYGCNIWYDPAQTSVLKFDFYQGGGSSVDYFIPWQLVELL